MANDNIIKTPEELEITQIWQEYRDGKDYLDNIGLFDRAEQSYNFVIGEQWKGLESGSVRPPQLNILYPMMKSSTAMVGQNSVNIVYSSLNYGENRPKLLQVCEALNQNSKKLWEKLKMDSKVWTIIENAYISGDSFIYFYDDGKDTEQRSISAEIVDTVNVMYGDEQQENLQEQPYILLIQRMALSKIKDIAKANGLTDDEIINILPDSDTELQINGEVEVKGNKKATLITKIWKEADGVHFAKATKNVVVQPDTFTGLELYPIANYSWKKKKGLARGVGDIYDKIPNQISINKALYRLEQSIKRSAYPIKAYREQAITGAQVAKLNQPGANIAVKSAVDGNLNNIISYIQPAQISSYAVTYWQDLINLTRTLSGAGDNLENINPEQASGTAINAVREAKELNVNGQINGYKQFIEDCALIWYDMLCKYSPNGVTVYDDDDNRRFLSVEDLNALKINVKVDVVPTDSTFTALRDTALIEALNNGHITFEEYVESLSDDSIAPKSVLENIIEKRARAENERSTLEKGSFQNFLDVSGQSEQPNNTIPGVNSNEMQLM